MNGAFEKGARPTEDHRIVDLFWQRSGDAITQVREKYGNYCYAIALRLLSDRLDAE